MIADIKVVKELIKEWLTALKNEARITHISKIDLTPYMMIELEDFGQDFLQFIVNADGFVLDTLPVPTAMWKGAFIPLQAVYVGRCLPINQPPYVYDSYLKYKVISKTLI